MGFPPGRLWVEGVEQVASSDLDARPGFKSTLRPAEDRCLLCMGSSPVEGGS